MRLVAMGLLEALGSTIASSAVSDSRELGVVMLQNEIHIEATVSVDGEPYTVLGYALRRTLFEVDRVVVTLADSTNDLPLPETWLGKAAAFELRAGKSQRTNLCGLVIGAQRVLGADNAYLQRIEICPPLWRLTKRTNHRVFQELSVKEVAEEVFSLAGLDMERDWRLVGGHPKRPYITQYNESDLDFVRRILAEEGIYFGVDYGAADATLRLTDNPKGLGKISGSTTLTFKQEFGSHGAGDFVFKLALAETLRPDKVTLRDFNWENARFDLTSRAEAKDDRTHSAEYYAYPGRTAEKDQLDARADYLLTALRADSQVLEGQTASLQLKPGFCFSVDDHPYSPINGEYLVTEVRFSASRPRQHSQAATTAGQGTQRAEFAAIPLKEGSYRPKTASTMRQVAGLQTAVTTGPGGDEIYTNQHGQVTVLFPWELNKPADQNSSVWMRTSQVPLGGSMLLPRMKWEVAVSAREGDVDHRVVMSRLYNSDSMPPYALPENKARMSLQTSTTPGGGSSNELRMSDTKGQEEMFFNGSKDMSVNVGNNATESVKMNYVTEVGANHDLKVIDSMMGNVGSNQSITVAVSQKTSVATLNVDEIGGDHTMSVGGMRTLMIGGDHRRTVGGSSTETVGAARIEAVVGAVSDSTLANMNQTVGAALVEVAAGSRSLMAAATRTETTGALKAILAKGGRGVQASALAVTVGGAVINIVKGDRSVSAGAMLADTVAGAQLVKAKNVTFTAQASLTIVMGASVITMTPASITFAGVSIKVDSGAIDLGAMIMNN
jgi:type VI secretion system secreted protein VgrG